MNINRVMVEAERKKVVFHLVPPPEHFHLIFLSFSRVNYGQKFVEKSYCCEAVIFDSLRFKKKKNEEGKSPETHIPHSPICLLFVKVALDILKNDLKRCSGSTKKGLSSSTSCLVFYV